MAARLVGLRSGPEGCRVMVWISNFLKFAPVKFATTFSIASMILLALGCHPLNGRWRGLNSTIDAGADDDWAPPKTSGYAQPKQYMRRSKPVETSDASVSRNSKTIQPAEYQTPGSDSGTEKKSATSKVVANIREESPTPQNSREIVDTDEQAVDIDGAIDALPPNLQDVARRQLAAIKNSRSEDDGPSKALAATDQSSTATKTIEDSKPRASISTKLTDQTDFQVALASNQSIVAPQPSSAKPDSAVVTAVTSPKNETSEVVPASASQPSSSQPLGKTAPIPDNPHWGPSIQEAITKLEKALEERPPQDENLRLSQDLTLRWLYLANRQLNEAMTPIEGLEEHEQDYFRYQVQALHEAGNPDASPSKPRRWSTVMNSQQKATNHLAAASNLEVRSLAFCTDVQGYGVLTKFPNYQFKPDQEILLYCELDNVFAEQVKAGYETQLQGTYEIIDPNGRRIADQLLPMEREICQNHRRDYFIIYHIFMPMQIAPGNYQMRVMIEDMKARKFGQSTLDFQIQK
jgi:hypothetical protein